MTQGEGGFRNVMQIQQEIRAMLEGEVRMGAQAAQQFQVIDVNFKQHMETARRTGTVYEYLNKLLEGQKQATKDMANTWESVHSSLRQVWAQVQIRAFGQAYDDTVLFGKVLIDTLLQGAELTERGNKLADAFGFAWSEAKIQVADLLDYMLDNFPQVVDNVKSVASAMGTIGGAAAGAVKEIAAIITQLRELSGNPMVQMLLGGALGSRLGPIGAAVGAIAYPGAKYLASGAGPDASYGLGAMYPDYGPGTPLIGYGTEGEGYVSQTVTSKPAPLVPRIRPFLGKEGNAGGAGGGKAAMDSVQKEIEKIDNAVEQARKTALDSINETWRLHWDLKQRTVKTLADRVQLEVDAHSKLSSIWDSVMSDEKLTFSERLSASEQYKNAHLKTIDDEINAIREKYGALVPDDALQKYKTSQIDALNKRLEDTMNPMAFNFEAAWKRAAENVQDALSDTIFNLMTQSKSTGDILLNLTNGMLRVMSQMAAQSLMNLAKYAIELGVKGLVPSLFGTTYGSSTATYTSPDYVPGGYGYQNYKHSGGMLYAHEGLKLRSDEVPFIGLTGERVLNRQETRDYEDRKDKGEWKITVVNPPGKPLQATAQQKEGSSSGDRELIIMLDEINAQLINAGGKTSQAMDKRYNIHPAITIRG
jgi:hypothetical protein